MLPLPTLVGWVRDLRRFVCNPHQMVVLFCCSPFVVIGLWYYFWRLKKPSYSLDDARSPRRRSNERALSLSAFALPKMISLPTSQSQFLCRYFRQIWVRDQTRYLMPYFYNSNDILQVSFLSRRFLRHKFRNHRVTWLPCVLSSNIPSDFSCCNTGAWTERRCQVCKFFAVTEDSCVRTASLQYKTNSNGLPLTNHSTWNAIRAESPQLRRHFSSNTASKIKVWRKNLTLLPLLKKVSLLCGLSNTPFINSTLLWGHTSTAKSIKLFFDTCHACVSLRRYQWPTHCH